jgi:phosphoglycerate dehydrogenase-like enzyme
MKPHPNASVLIVESEHPSDIDHFSAAIAKSLPTVRVHSVRSRAEAIAWRGDVTAVIGKAHTLPAELVKALPHLDWVQALTTGVDTVLAMNLPAHVTISSARGVHGPQMSELCFMLMLNLLRDFPRMQRNQSEARWQRWPQRLLKGKTIAIIGVGMISLELAARCQSFGMRVIGVSDSQSSASGFDELQPRAQLHAVAARCDFLVALVPYAPATHHMINAAVLAAMRPDSYFINIARGPVADETALIEALRARRIAGAGLDVFEIEPLAADSALWSMPNVIITPHIGGMSDDYAEQLTPLLLHNLGCYVRGESAAMQNLVER